MNDHMGEELRRGVQERPGVVGPSPVHEPRQREGCNRPRRSPRIHPGFRASACGRHCGAHGLAGGTGFGKRLPEGMGEPRQPGHEVRHVHLGGRGVPGLGDGGGPGVPTLPVLRHSERGGGCGRVPQTAGCCLPGPGLLRSILPRERTQPLRYCNSRMATASPLSDDMHGKLGIPQSAPEPGNQHSDEVAERLAEIKGRELRNFRAAQGRKWANRATALRG